MTTQQLQPAAKKPLVVDPEKGVQFIPYGQPDELRLSIDIIKKVVAVPTRTGQTCSDRDAVKFMMMCQAARLNPFAGDAFLIGYDTKNGPSFSLITAHQAFLKRAELHPEYDGKESGVVVLMESGEQELHGDYMPKGAELVGGWCRVFFKQRKYPEFKKLNLENFIQTYEYEDRKTGETIKKVSGQWLKNPAGMICKCAEADALRSAFPTMLGGMYLDGEQSIPIHAEARTVNVAATAGLVATMEAPKRIEQPKQQADGDDDDGDLGPTSATAPKTEPLPSGDPTPQQKVEAICEKAGMSFDQFHDWGTASGQLTKPDNVTTFGEIPTDQATRILRAQKLMLEQFAKAKQEAQ